MIATKNSNGTYDYAGTVFEELEYLRLSLNIQYIKWFITFYVKQ